MERGDSAKIAAASLNLFGRQAGLGRYLSKRNRANGGFECGKGLRMFLHARLIDQILVNRRFDEAVDDAALLFLA